MIKYINASCIVYLPIDFSISQTAFQKQMRTAIELATDIYFKNRKEQTVKSVYEVIIVDPEVDEVVRRELIIATSSENAKFRVLRKVLNEDQDPDDFDIFVGTVGNLKPRKEE